MTTLYHVEEDRRGWTHSFDINASRTWGLSGIKCSTCGKTWSSVGLGYPWIDLSQLPNERIYRKRGPHDNEEFNRRCRPIRELLGSDLPLEPGTDFGSLVGTAWGNLGDFGWLSPWDMLVSERTLSILTNEGIKLPHVVKADLRFRKRAARPYYEIGIDAFVEMSLSTFEPGTLKSCARCGREAGHLAEMVIREGPVPEHSDVFRVRGFWTYILITERFAEVIRRHQMTNILLKEVKVSDS